MHDIVKYFANDKDECFSLNSCVMFDKVIFCQTPNSRWYLSSLHSGLVVGTGETLRAKIRLLLQHTWVHTYLGKFDRFHFFIVIDHAFLVQSYESLVMPV